MSTKQYIIYFLMGFIACLGGFFLLSGGHTFPNHYLILPHFVIAPEKIDVIRKNLTASLTTDDPVIIIISPDHFNIYNTNNFIYTPKISTLCIQGYCHDSQGAFLPIGQNSQYTIQNHTLILPDHGIGAHLRFIKKWLPNSTIIPILLQARDFAHTENIIRDIQQIAQGQETIVIGSVDWSHYVPEPRAMLHDYTSWSIMQESSDQIQRGKLDIDCPSCLWIVDTLAQDDNQYASILRRDSSSEIFHTTGLDNTSRIAIQYSNQHHPEQKINTGISILLGGMLNDENSGQPKTDPFQQRYQEYDISQNPLFSFHRLGASVDLSYFTYDTTCSTCESLSKSLGNLDITLLPYGKNQTLSIRDYNLALLYHHTDEGLETICRSLQQYRELNQLPLLTLAGSHEQILAIASNTVDCGAKVIIGQDETFSLNVQYKDTTPIILGLGHQSLSSGVPIVPKVGLYIGPNHTIQVFQ